jgi:S1-C subfamily serine protease
VAPGLANGKAGAAIVAAMNQGHDRDAIHARAQQIALIQDAEGLGTGLVVSPDGWILTNKHVAPNAGPFRVVLAGGQNVHGVGVHQSAHHDLAMVKIAAPTGAFLDLEREVNDAFRVGDVVYAIGHPRGCRFSVARGFI